MTSCCCRQFAATIAALDAHILRPARKDEPGQGPHLAPIRQRIESIFWTCKDLLGLERHGARTLHGLRVRLSQRSSPSPPRSPSTTDSADPAARWRPTPPKTAESLI